MKTNNAVTIIGLGAMGRAMAQAYLHKGYAVTVWNRTQHKAQHLVSQGAVLAAKPAEANNLLILSLTSYDSMYTILAAENIAGKTIINMSSGTPEDARKAVAWANERGAQLLSGGIMASPPLIGQGETSAYTFYSGDKQVFSRYRQQLEVMTATDYVGEDPGLAMLYYQALSDALFTSVAGVLHALALIRSAGIPAKTFEPHLNNLLVFMPELFRMSRTIEEVDKREYNGEEDNMVMIKAVMDHIVQTSMDAGVNTALPHMIRQLAETTIAKGHAKSGINSLIEALWSASPAHPES